MKVGPLTSEVRRGAADRRRRRGTRGGTCPPASPCATATTSRRKSVSTVFYSATVSGTLALVIAESVKGTRRLTWEQRGATQLWATASTTCAPFPWSGCSPPSGRGAEAVAAPRARRADVPAGADRGRPDRRVRRHDHPRPQRPHVDVRIISTANEHGRALRAAADAHERRFSALTERSPIPPCSPSRACAWRTSTMRSAPSWDCGPSGCWAPAGLNTIHEDLDGVIEQVAAALDGDEVETGPPRARGRLRPDHRHPVHLFTPGVGAGFVGTIEDITDRLAFEIARPPGQPTR